MTTSFEQMTETEICDPAYQETLEIGTPEYKLHRRWDCKTCQQLLPLDCFGGPGTLSNCKSCLGLT